MENLRKRLVDGVSIASLGICIFVFNHYNRRRRCIFNRVININYFLGYILRSDASVNKKLRAFSFGQYFINFIARCFRFYFFLPLRDCCLFYANQANIIGTS